MRGEARGCAAVLFETDRDGLSSWAGHRLCFEVDAETVLRKAPRHVPHRRDLGDDAETGIFRLGTGRTVAIGGVADDLGRIVVPFERLDETGHGLFVRGVRRGEEHLVDELGVRADANVNFVTIEPACLGLVTMASLGVDRRSRLIPGVNEPRA